MSNNHSNLSIFEKYVIIKLLIDSILKNKKCYTKNKKETLELLDNLYFNGIKL